MKLLKHPPGGVAVGPLPIGSAQTAGPTAPIVPAGETLVRLANAPALFPAPISSSSLTRYVNGVMVRGQKITLQHVRQGKSVFTCRTWVDAFLAECRAATEFQRRGPNGAKAFTRLEAKRYLDREGC